MAFLDALRTESGQALIHKSSGDAFFAMVMIDGQMVDIATPAVMACQYGAYGIITDFRDKTHAGVVV